MNEKYIKIVLTLVLIFLLSIYFQMEYLTNFVALWIIILGIFHISFLIWRVNKK
jgi:hypothetical protein